MSAARLRRVALTGAAVIVIAAALVALVAVLRGRLSDTDGRIFATLAAMLLAGGTAAVGAALLDGGVSPRLARLTIALAPLGFVLLAFGIWSFAFYDGSETGVQLGWTGVLVLLWGLAAAGARVMASTSTAVRLAWATTVLGGVAVILSLVATWRDDAGDALWKLIAVTWILLAVGLLLTPIVERRNVPTDANVRTVATLGDVDLVAIRGAVRHSTDLEVAPRLERGETLVMRQRPPERGK
jgi:hypothetical protein